MRWDDVAILQAIDRLQQQHGGTALWSDGRQIMEEMAGGHSATSRATAVSCGSC